VLLIFDEISLSHKDLKASLKSVGWILVLKSTNYLTAGNSLPTMVRLEIIDS